MSDFRTHFCRALLFLSTGVLLFALFLCAVLGVLFLGPSEEACRLAALSFEETSALKFIPRLYLPEERYNEILHSQEIPSSAEPDFVPEAVGNGPAGQVAVEEDPDFDVLVEEVKGPRYKGKMMIVADPRRVFVGTLDRYGYDEEGLYLHEFLEKYGAVGGTNAGGFDDPGGMGRGGMADGIVLRDGTIVCGSETDFYQNFLGFDAEGILHVGSGTGREILDSGIVTGVSFGMGRTLIENGTRYKDLGGGLNPRTALGQRADGAVLLLVIEGRHPGSLGASYDDLAEIMEGYGAVNAGMLDGGSSSIMYYEGEQITRGSNIVGMRQLATSILVLAKEDPDE